MLHSVKKSYAVEGPTLYCIILYIVFSVRLDVTDFEICTVPRWCDVITNVTVYILDNLF